MQEIKYHSFELFFINNLLKTLLYLNKLRDIRLVFMAKVNSTGFCLCFYESMQIRNGLLFDSIDIISREEITMWD